MRAATSSSYFSKLFLRSATSTFPLSSQADNDNSHAGHDGAGCIRSVGAAGDQANISVGLPGAFQIRLDGQKASKFTLTTRIWLQ